MHVSRLRLYAALQRLMARLGLCLPGKIMYIGGSDTLPAPLSREEEGRLILLSAAGCYALLTLVFRRSARHGFRELRTAAVSFQGRTARLTALVDTGNTLADPVTGRPVLVAEGEKLRALLPAAQVDLRDPVAALEALSPLSTRFRLLPYRAVGVDCGFLLAMHSDGVQVGQESYGDILVALSPTPVSDGGGYSALIGA